MASKADTKPAAKAAKTKKTAVAAKAAPPVKKVRAPRKSKAAAIPEAPVRQQPDEVQPGRFYHYQTNDTHVVGELAAESDGVHSVKVWSMGKATGETRDIPVADLDVREISRADAHDISKVH